LHNYHKNNLSQMLLNQVKNYVLLINDKRRKIKEINKLFLKNLKRSKIINNLKNMERFTILRVILAQGPC